MKMHPRGKFPAGVRCIISYSPSFAKSKSSANASRSSFVTGSGMKKLLPSVPPSRLMATNAFGWSDITTQRLGPSESCTSSPREVV